MNEIFNLTAQQTIANLPDNYLDCVITSPPYYGLRDYGHEAQLGAERTLQEYISNLVNVFVLMRPKLKNSATLFVNIGDCYAGSGKGVWKTPSADVKERYIPNSESVNAKISKDLPAKNLMLVPARFAIAMQEAGFILRNDIIWNKTNAMPSSVADRFVCAHEHIFFFSVNPRYYFDIASAKEPAVSTKGKSQNVNKYTEAKPNYKGLITAARKAYEFRTRRDVWRFATARTTEKHFAAYPEYLVEACLLPGCPVGGVVYDRRGSKETWPGIHRLRDKPGVRADSPQASGSRWKIKNPDG